MSGRIYIVLGSLSSPAGWFGIIFIICSGVARILYSASQYSWSAGFCQRAYSVTFGKDGKMEQRFDEVPSERHLWENSGYEKDPAYR